MPYQVEVACVLAEIRREDNIGGVTHDVGVPGPADGLISSQQVLHSRSGDGGAWPEGVDGHLVLELLGHSQHAHGHAVLGHGVGEVGRKPLGVHGKGRGEVEDVGILGFKQVRQTVLGDHESASDVDLVHEVVFLHGLVDSSHQVDCRCVVDQDINASEGFHHLRNALLYPLLVTDVALQSEGFAAGLHDVLTSCVDSAWQVGLRSGCFGEDGNVGAVSGTAEADCESNASGSASNDDSLALERLVLGNLVLDEFQSVHILRYNYDISP